MNIGIVGNRKGWNYEFVKKNIKEIGVSKSDVIITGGATGVDTFAHRYAIDIGAEIHIIHPDIYKPIPQRYFDRNQEIVSQSDKIIAFNKDNNPRTGTQNTINHAKKMGKKVIIIDKEDEMSI